MTLRDVLYLKKSRFSKTQTLLIQINSLIIESEKATKYRTSVFKSEKLTVIHRTT